jgi:hypothetical protein
LNINELIATTLEASSKEGAKQLLAKAATKDNVMPEDDNSEEERPDDGGEPFEMPPPLYQTYLVDKLGLQLPTPDKPYWAKRRVDSAQLRKKMVAAYLSLCKEFSVDARYASAKMVEQMSDHCIRDYLRFIHEIFIESKLGLREFLETKIPALTQDKAIKRASGQKWNLLRESGVLAPSEAGRIIDCLARITAYIQAKSPDGSHLEATERGMFTFKLSSSETQSYGAVIDLIRDAAQAGYLMIMEEGVSRWRFRVHTSLAACYEFSYRGAYYDTPMSAKDLEDIRICLDMEEFNKKVERMCNALAGWTESTPLFEVN